MLPKGARHTFWKQQSFNYHKLFHKLPGNSDPYITYWDLNGNILQIRPPGNTGIVIQRYNSDGQISAIVSGDRNTKFKYNERNMLTSIEHNRAISVKTNFQYEQGILSDQRINFDAKSAFADAKFSYDNDRNLNIKRIKGRIGGQPIPKVGLYYGKENNKILQDIGYFTIESQGLNGTVLSDGKVKYSRGDNYFTLSIDNKEAFRAEYIHNECNKIEEIQMLLKRSSGFFKQTKRFSYDDDGQILEVKENNHIWKYDYDSNGNMIKLLFGKNEHLFSYDDWDQLIRYNQAVLSYDILGRTVRNYKKQQFAYGTNNLLMEVSLPRTDKKITYFYDHLDRLVGRKDSTGNITQFHYARPDKPYLVTNIYHPRESRITSLVYDNEDILIFARVNQENYYIVCDQVGAPFLFFSSDGNLIKEVSRSPFGHITYDSYPGLKVPVGIFGGIQDDETGLLHIQQEERRAVYDPFMGSFLAPDWLHSRKNIHQPEMFLLYRINGNDPSNLPHRRRRTGKTNILSQGDNPLLFSDFKVQHAKTLQLLSRPFPLFSLQKLSNFAGFPLDSKAISADLSYPSSDETTSMSLVSSSMLGFMRHLSFFQRIFSLPHSSLVESKIYPEFVFSSQEPPFGNFIVLSKQNDRVNVYSGPGANQIYQNVFTSVLNNSRAVDFETVSHGTDSFYFTKPDSWKTSDDIAQLRRLGSKVNLTVHESQFDASKTMDVKVHLSSTVINIRYGTDPLREKARLLRHSARVVIRKAWAREKELIDSGEKTVNTWTPKEIKQIQTKGSVDGWEVEYGNPPAKFPELASDMENVFFTRTGKKHTRH